MTTAGEIAIELRKLADALDKEPEAEIEHISISSYHLDVKMKSKFLNLARLLPRPLAKEYSNTDLKLIYGHPWCTPIAFTASIPRSAICELVEPAKPAVYRCDPILSDEEEAAL